MWNIDCEKVSAAMKSPDSLNAQGVDLDNLLEHIADCDDCDAKYPPLSEEEFSRYMEFIAEKLEKKDNGESRS